MGTYEEPKTYTTDKYIITDTRGLEPYAFEHRRKLHQRAYMETLTEGNFNYPSPAFKILIL